jgi:hypothetical protein
VRHAGLQESGRDLRRGGARHRRAVTELNVQARLKAALPPKAGIAATPVANATKGFVTGQLATVMASRQFQAIWTATLTSMHQLLVAVLRGEHTAAVSTSGGYAGHRCQDGQESRAS